MRRCHDKPIGFTLVELLVVVGIISLLLGIMVPALSKARVCARIVKAHAELRSITIALDIYRYDWNRGLPPTRFSCSSRTAYELPVELVSYLPSKKVGEIDVIDMPDPFYPDEEMYKYRAVGTAIMNESTILQNAATLWVPDDFPNSDSDVGRYYNDPDDSPVRYAVWSVGTDPESPKFDLPGRIPVPRKYWLNGASDTGVITHMEDRDGMIYTSP